MNKIKGLFYWTLACTIVGAFAAIAFPLMFAGAVLGFAFAIFRLGFDDGQSAVGYILGLLVGRKS